MLIGPAFPSIDLLHASFAAGPEPQDYSDRLVLQAAIGVRRDQAVFVHKRENATAGSRPDAVEKCNVLCCFSEPGDAFVLGAMLFCDGGRALDIARIADLDGSRIALKKEGLWSRAGHTHTASQCQT
jgi:hypothetical protein